MADLSHDGASLQRRSKTAVIVSLNAAIFGLVAFLAGVLSTISESSSGGSIADNVGIACYGLATMAAAVGHFRHRLWAAILWSALSGSIVGIPLLFPLMSSADWVIVGILTLQFTGSQLGVWAIVRWRSRRKELQPIVWIYQLERTQIRRFAPQRF